jgi:hypothetical protein
MPLHLTVNDVGVTVQGYDADLAAIGALASAANKLPYATGAQAWALTDLSAFARTILDDADAATVRGTIGAGTSSFSGAYGDLTGIPSSFSPSAHKTSHQDGGSDEISVQGLDGVLNTPQPLTSAQDYGASFTVPTGAITTVMSRATISSSNRITISGTGRLTIQDVQSVPVGNASPGSISIPSGQVLSVLDRVQLNGNARLTLVGKARLVVTTPNGPVSRLVLSGVSR